MPLDDYVGRAAYYVGDLDPKITRVIRKFVRRGDTVIDVGANLGLVTLWASALVGPEGSVHAFEPQPRLVELLRASLEYNGRRNVRVHPTALGANEGEMELSISPNNAGASSFVHQRCGPTIRVPVRRLSDIMKAERVTRVRLVKIDTEGFEAPVLEGGLDWIEVHKPDAILFEGDNEDRRPHEFLTRLGYKILALPRALFRLDMRPYREGMHVHDFLAVRCVVPK